MAVSMHRAGKSWTVCTLFCHSYKLHWYYIMKTEIVLSGLVTEHSVFISQQGKELPVVDFGSFENSPFCHVSTVSAIPL